jgi:hypothetical protein
VRNLPEAEEEPFESISGNSHCTHMELWIVPATLKDLLIHRAFAGVLRKFLLP